MYDARVDSVRAAALIVISAVLAAACAGGDEPGAVDAGDGGQGACPVACEAGQVCRYSVCVPSPAPCIREPVGPSAGEDPLDWLAHLVLPALSVGLVSGSIIFRFVRSSVLESLNQDYIRTARAKGLSNWKVIRDHVLPNAWIPIVTVIGLQLGFLLGGVIVVEVIFAWPGLGRLALLAVQDRDFTVLQGSVLYVAFMFLLINLIVDIVYGWLDPRIRYD